MLRLHHQDYWWFLQWDIRGYQAYARSWMVVDKPVWEVYSTTHPLGSLWQPIIIFPDTDGESIDYHNFDILFDHVENYEGILFGAEKHFEYEGHTWNDVSNFKVTGDIYDFDMTQMRTVDYRTMGYKDTINPLTGDEYACLFPVVYTHSRHQTQTMRHNVILGSHGTSIGIKTDVSIPVFYYFDAKTNNCYYGVGPSYGMDSDGLLCNAYLKPVGADGQYNYYSFTIWKFRVVGKDPMGRPNLIMDRQNGLYDEFGVNTTSVLVFRGTTAQQVVKRLEAMCRIDANYRGPLQNTTNTTSIGYLSAANNRVAGTGISPEVKEANYYSLFPMSDRKHNQCNWNAIAAEAYQTLGMSDINGIAGISDLLNFYEDVSKFVGTISDIPAKGIRAIAGAYLGVHYGFKLMILDAKTLQDTMEKYVEKRSNLSRCQASYKWSCGDENSLRNYTARYQVNYDEFAQLRSILAQLIEIADAAPSIENWWDMVPMSFVVDWFISIGDVLQSLDTYANLTQKHEVICCGRSIKGSRILRPEDVFIETPKGFRMPFNVVATYYTRQYQKELILPSLVPSVTINPFNHLIEGAALIISRR